ncbi:hypothetical protein HPP92_014924 [Vanilla planifolia]|uniref:Uncharacterized protein n=1 Tax=Vanilla planifolia TaxID=51239 RepID=A0A835QSJ9_VANPL|nr:hypothetical protein HPP92_014924 [Vanilla planifolia]
MKPPSFSRISGLLPSSDITTAMTNTQNNDTIDSFVKAQLLIYSNGSPYYHNLDNRVVITLATLSFYCYRPTILAILEFVDAINVMENAPTENDSKSPMPNISTANFNSVEDGPTSYIIDEPVAKGFLSNGKTRIIFFLSLNMATAQIFLMNEDETSLATLSQNNLVADIKVFSSSFSIKAALGNLKISDDTLPRSHSYYWACDMRNPEGSSFVELDFSSFSENDEDYNGYDYSLTGKLSEVRIVYLNRFVQEVTSYFMGLVPRNSETFVKLKDHGTNSEKQFPTSEIQGSPALKLDLLLSRPIILMPKRTQSADYLKLDAKHITVQNTFRWLGGDKNEISAVRLDIMTVKVHTVATVAWVHASTAQCQGVVWCMWWLDDTGIQGPCNALVVPLGVDTVIQCTQALMVSCCMPRCSHCHTNCVQTLLFDLPKHELCCKSSRLEHCYAPGCCLA